MLWGAVFFPPSLSGAWLACEGVWSAGLVHFLQAPFLGEDLGKSSVKVWPVRVVCFPYSPYFNAGIMLVWFVFLENVL